MWATVWIPLLAFVTLVTLTRSPAPQSETTITSSAAKAIADTVIAADVFGIEPVIGTRVVGSDNRTASASVPRHRSPMKFGQRVGSFDTTGVPVPAAGKMAVAFVFEG